MYGEIEYDSFRTILSIAMVGMKQKKKFVDLGAGLGKACLWVALTTSFEEIVGIEVIRGLVDQSRGILGEFHKDMNKKSLHVGCLSLNLEHGDLSAEIEWEDADLIFANSTCFTEQLMMKLSVKSQACKTGTRFITFTSSLDSPYWKSNLQTAAGYELGTSDRLCTRATLRCRLRLVAGRHKYQCPRL